MSIELEDLSVLAYANGFTLWHYRTSQDATGLCADGSLNGVDDMVRPGDLIIVSGGNGPSAAAGLLVVAEGAPDGLAATPLSFGVSPSPR